MKDLMDGLDRIDQLLDKIEINLIEMDNKLNDILKVIGKYNNNVVTNVNDGEIMFRYKDKK